ATLLLNGQAMIPKYVRHHLHIEPGERIKFFVHPYGSVVILPKIPTSRLKGIDRARRQASLNDMETAIGDGAVTDCSFHIIKRSLPASPINAFQPRSGDLWEYHDAAVRMHEEFDSFARFDM